MTVIQTPTTPAIKTTNAAAKGIIGFLAKLTPSAILASSIYDWANVGLIVSLVIGVVSTVLIVWMGNIKETDLRTRLSEAESRSTLAQGAAGSAGEAAAKANERAAELERQAEVLKTANLQLEAQIAPRRISLGDCMKIAKALSGFAGRTVEIRSYALDVEAAVLGQQLLFCLQKAGINAVDQRMSDEALGNMLMGVGINGSDSELMTALGRSLTSDGHLSNVQQRAQPIQSAGIRAVSVQRVKIDASIFVGVKPMK